MRGSGLWNRVQWVRETRGAEGIEAVLGRVSAATRNVVRDVIDDRLDRRAWHNYPLFLELCVAIDELWGEGDGKLNIEMARWGAHQAMPALYAVFIKLGSVEWILHRSAKLWREHFNEGHLEIRTEKGTRQAEGEVVDWPVPHLAHTYSVLGFAVGCVELSGGKDVRGDVVSCRSHGGDRTILRVQWT